MGVCFALSTLGSLSFAVAADLESTRLPSQGTSDSVLSEVQFYSEILKLVPPAAKVTCHGSYFNWGRGRDGWGYCYEYSCSGAILNGGYPVSNGSCETTRPSYYNWGRGQNGWGYCYQWTPYGVAMNQGHPVANFSCEATRPSYYAWGRSNDGWTRCYQWTPQGLAMNDGYPVANYLCH